LEGNWKISKQAEAVGEIHRVFVGSMMDILKYTHAAC
jgi:hypothetical protein